MFIEIQQSTGEDKRQPGAFERTCSGVRFILPELLLDGTVNLTVVWGV